MLLWACAALDRPPPKDYIMGHLQVGRGWWVWGAVWVWVQLFDSGGGGDVCVCVWGGGQGHRWVGMKGDVGACSRHTG
jgi:hypothetical protein